MQDTEDSLKKEAKIGDADFKGSLPLDSDVQTVLSSYASDENPDEYTDAYTQLKNFIDTSLDAYKVPPIQSNRFSLQPFYNNVMTYFNQYIPFSV